MRFFLSLLFASLATASTLQGYGPHLGKRDDSVCTDLSVSSNNGDRKVAIVLDSSGSMAYNDPYDLRIVAGRALNDFLISSGEAGGSKKADLVTVIDFDDTANLDYPLGDPGGANSSFSNVDASGGTYIALGVNMAIDQLSSGGGATNERSAIVVFTDGEDSSTDELVDAINNATAAGIRVSFGFLDPYISSQPKTVLAAVKNSRGVYATITVAAGSQNFINYVLLNGLTYNDNPQGYDEQLLAGLSETHFISGSNTVTLKYSAQAGERVNFTVTSISAGQLNVVASQGGQTLQSAKASYSYATIAVTAPNTGSMDLQITGVSAPADGMFSVTTNSNVPFKNCTVGVTGSGSGGLSSGAKAGVGVGVTAAVIGLGALGGYFAYKHFMGGGGSSAAAPPSGGESNLAYGPGGEKTMASTNVYPVDGTHGLGPGTNGLPPNGQPFAPSNGGPMTGPPGPHATAPNFAPTGQGGFAPPGPGGIPPPTAHMPLTAGPGVPGSTAPMAFIPPMVPPNSFNNSAPKDGQGSKGAPGSPESQSQALYNVPGGNYPPNSFGQPGGQAPMGNYPNGGGQPMTPGSQTMSPMSPSSQGMTSPAGSSAYPPTPASQATPGSYGYGPDVQTMAPGSQGYMGSHPSAPGSGSYPPGPASQAAPSPYASGPESFQHNAPPGAYQGHMAAPGGHGYPGTSQYPLSSGPGGADGYTHMSGPGGQHVAPPNPMGGEYNQSMPMSGAEGYNQHHTMVGPGGQNIAPPNPMGGDGSGYNHSMGGGQLGQGTMSPGPEGYHQHGTGAPGSGPYDSTAPTSNTMTPHTTGGQFGGDMYHQHGGPGGGDLASHPHGGHDATPGQNSHQTHPGTQQPSGPQGGDINHQPGDGDYHDPDSCSCSEGPGPDSGDEYEYGRDGANSSTTTAGNPGFTMPGAPVRSPEKKHKHKRRRFPRLARSRVAKHHHHAWLGRDAECTDAVCPMNRPEHVCLRGEDGEKCECKCRDEECEVYKRRLRERRERDGGVMGVMNVVS